MSDVATETQGVPDDVVNQRLLVTVYMTATENRTGQMGVAVFLDRDTSPGIPFVIDGFRGWNGEGLSDHEKRYVAAALVAAAAEVDSGA